jgi:hypothetical protein
VVLSFRRAIYVQITEEELESLEAEANNGIEFPGFVAVEKDRPQFTSRGRLKARRLRSAK